MARLEREDSDIYQEAIRLNKFLAMAGVGSRRKNDELILTGAVKINGQVVHQLGTRVSPEKDFVTVHGKPVTLAAKNVYILLNKPKDSISTLKDEKGRTTIMSYVRVKERVFPIGRLDRNTTGVLILTNDGEFGNRMMHPKAEIERVYRVRLDSAVKTEDLGALRKGIHLEDGLAKAEWIEAIKGSGRRRVVIAIREGRNREVRRMFESLGYDVKQLDRASFGGITTEGLPRGKWRFLTNREVKYLSELAQVKPGSKGISNELGMTTRRKIK